MVMRVDLVHLRGVLAREELAGHVLIQNHQGVFYLHVESIQHIRHLPARPGHRPPVLVLERVRSHTLAADLAFNGNRGTVHFWLVRVRSAVLELDSDLRSTSRKRKK